MNNQAVAQVNAKTASRFSSFSIYNLFFTLDIRAVFIKLLLFSIALGLGPILTYFASLRFIWHGLLDALLPETPFDYVLHTGNTTYAALTAILVANGVLAGYIIMSLNEDSSSQDVQKGKKYQ